MAKSIEEVLGWVSLTKTVQAVQTGIPDNLPAAFYTTKENVLGDEARWVQFRGVRRTARMVVYGAPALQRELRPLEERPIKLLHSFENIRMKPLTLQRLRNYADWSVQKMGIDEVDRQQSEFRIYFDNLRLSATYQALALGHIYFDSSGNLLPTSSGATRDIDMKMSANNQNQLNGIITASWSLVNTDIPAQLRALKARAAQQTGYPLKYAFYGINIPSYLTQNNYVLDYLARTPTMATKFLESAELPDGLFGLTWVPVYTSFFEDQNGVNQTLFGVDQVCFTPDINQMTWRFFEGSYLVPSTFNATRDLAAALGTMKPVQGMFSYALPVHNPMTVEMYCGDTFLSAMIVPDAFFSADVTP